ncbi:kinase D-interacting substrate of 220 kDa B isoform X4 [Festucalex cinctus]
MDTTTSIKMTTMAIQKLFGHVEEENLTALRDHLDRFKEVDGRSDNGQTPLMLAAEQGSLEIVQELIRRGANVNLDDVDCWSALISAAKEGHVEVVKELLDNSAYVEHRDVGGWTALMWAAYKGRVEVAKALLEHGANPNTTGQYSVYPIIWASGRGHADVVKLLLDGGAKVNCSDKYGTTSLIWASRKGHFRCVTHLLENGADVDQDGANSMTALIVAVKGGFADVVKELLKRNPNVNMTDKDGNTALMIAAKEGYTEIVQDLLDAGTYVNIPDRSGDTVLIGAVRGGHVEIVRALLHKYADIDIRGQESKTALYWAVEKGNAAMVRDILQCNPDTETCTKDGETPLIKATKMRSIDIVELLLDKGAKVSAVDKRGDTPLHIAIRGRSRRLAELLLRNPKDGRLLYRPNKAGETPYNVDCSHQKSILTQIFGARHLSPSECDGDMLAYDLYSSALADILSEPTMQPPICVGLYAQWGSGKSFLLKKLEDEMKTFAGQQMEPLLGPSWLAAILSLLLCGAVALALGFTSDPKLAAAVSLSLLALLYIFFVVVYFGGRREGDNWNWAWLLSNRLARHIGYLELLLKLMFVNPPELPEQSARALPVRFLFTDYNRLSSVGGETSMAEMIATLSDACEREFGFLATRLFRVFKTDDTQGKSKWKKTCCVPSFVLSALVTGCLASGAALLAVLRAGGDKRTLGGALMALGGVVGAALLLNCRTWWRLSDAVLNSQRKRLHGAANKMHKLKSEGFMKVLKSEVELMAKMAKTIDGFTRHQTRLAVVIDSLDSCEQDKVLQMLDTVRVLFSKGPFISIFASDPHIIIKAINQNLNSVLRDFVNGHDYMRNIVHLPVFLNSRGLSGARKMGGADSAGAPANGDAAAAEGGAWHEELDRKLSQHSLGELAKCGSGKSALGRRDTYRRRQAQRSLTRQMSLDLTKLMVAEDWLTDISPQSMRRLLNIVSVTGRLLRANQIAFNWDRLASWINLTEQWPYRTSWLLLFLEESDGVPERATLKNVYERVLRNIPTSKDVEPLLEIDGDVRAFEVFVASRTPVLTAGDVRTFLPCTVNLDPKLREIIADVRAAREQADLSAAGYPSLQEVRPAGRPASVYSQVSSACSPSASFGGAPPPHSSYYSGMAGPQHPFYNRGSASVVSATPPTLLSAVTTEGVCERVRQIPGMDQAMLAAYTATIRKANANGRVLSQCNLDELKNEMNMNFGDWQLFRANVLEMRQAESQALYEEAASEQGDAPRGPRPRQRRVARVQLHAELRRPQRHRPGRAARAQTRRRRCRPVDGRPPAERQRQQPQLAGIQQRHRQTDRQAASRVPMRLPGIHRADGAVGGRRRRQTARASARTLRRRVGRQEGQSAVRQRRRRRAPSHHRGGREGRPGLLVQVAAGPQDLGGARRTQIGGGPALPQTGQRRRRVGGVGRQGPDGRLLAGAQGQGLPVGRHLGQEGLVRLGRALQRELAQPLAAGRGGGAVADGALAPDPGRRPHVHLQPRRGLARPRPRPRVEPQPRRRRRGAQQQRQQRPAGRRRRRPAPAGHAHHRQRERASGPPEAGPEAGRPSRGLRRHQRRRRLRRRAREHPVSARVLADKNNTLNIRPTLVKNRNLKKTHRNVGLEERDGDQF